MSDMADVLNMHVDYEYTKNLGYYRSEYLCECGGTFWAGEHAGDPNVTDAMNEHVAAALSAAGFGPMREAQEAAWDEGYTTGNAHNGRRDANPYREDT